MQLSAAEQLCALALCAKIGSAEEDVVRAGRVAKQQKLASADHSIGPLSEAGVLQRVLDFVGPGHWLLMSLVSKDWRKMYLLVPEQQIIGPGSQFAGIAFMCKPRMMLLKAAVASAAVMELSCECGVPLGSSSLQFIAGRFADVATLSAALQRSMPLRAEVSCIQ
jgi:hypothetical protein